MSRAMVCGFLLVASVAQAGHNDCKLAVQISHAKAAPRDAKTALVSFDLEWDLSWRQEGNSHDALWVLFKVRPEGSTAWQPVHLVADKVKNPAGYGQKSGTPLEFLVPADEGGAIGMFVRRAEYGYGLACATNVTAVMELPKPLNPEPRTLNLEISACAVEMVYIPEGAFYLNTGGFEPFRFYQYTDGTQHNQPYRVTSEGAIPTGQQAGKLWARREAQPEDNGELPAAFPKGYGAFYCMKKQIKGGHYDNFVGTLTAEQMAKYCPTNYTVPQAGDEERRLHSYGPLSWGDAIAFAAWAGLRPMSELEYAKVGRGTMEPTIDTGDTLDHPSCWGVEDWTGWRTSPERTVTVANPQGRGFKGTHGNGTVAVPADWPQEDAVGSGIRGGYGPVNGHPSTRTGAARAEPARIPFLGWRGVRTAPKEAAE